MFVVSKNYTFHIFLCQSFWKTESEKSWGFTVNVTAKKKLTIVLAYPTSYDERGYARRFNGGIFMSPYVLEVLEHITKDIVSRISDVASEVLTYNLQLKHEALRFFEIEKTFSASSEHIVILAMIGVMSYQVSYCQHTMRRWRQRGAVCFIGGPHVSGALAEMLEGVPEGSPHPGSITDELKILVDEGFILYRGDAYPGDQDSPGVWELAIRDAINGKTKSMYEGGLVPLDSAPIPAWKSRKGYRLQNISIDQQSGCPYFQSGHGCKFCGIGSMSGKIFRERNSSTVLSYFEESLRNAPKNVSIFPIGDNGSRSKNCMEFLKGLAVLRKKYSFNITFQADTQCYKIPEFLDWCEKAGISILFIGIETINREVLNSIGKFQNDPDQYKDLCDAIWSHDIVPSGSVMIGLPHHTPKVLREEVKQMCKYGIWPQFTVLSPSPGSPLTSIARNNGNQILMGEMSVADSAHVVLDHHHMSREEWQNAYWDCYRLANTLFYQIPRLRRLRSWSSWFLSLKIAFGFWRASRTKTHPLLQGSGKCFDEFDLKPGSISISNFSKFIHYVNEFILNLECIAYISILIMTTIPVVRHKSRSKM